MVDSLERQLAVTRAPAGLPGLAERLLRATVLHVGRQAYRLLEVEFYYRAQGHLDPFAHAQPIQRSAARWYFHRQGSSYRGGSFKGVDITFGPQHSFGGILIRSLRSSEGTVVNGSSLCVDTLLAQTKVKTIAALDSSIDGRNVDDKQAPIWLGPIEFASDPIYETARVGLTLKRAQQFPEMPDYLLRPYRYVIDPRAVKKGRVHVIIAMHQRGLDTTEIRELTGSPRATVDRYLKAYELGRSTATASSSGANLADPLQLCRLHGAYAANKRSVL